MISFPGNNDCDTVLAVEEEGVPERKLPLMAAADGKLDAYVATSSDQPYKDVLFLLLFAVHLLVLVATAFSYGLVSVSNEGPRFIEISKSDDISVTDNRSLATIIFVGLLIIMGTAMTASIVWVFVLSRLAHTIVNAILFSLVMLPVISGAAICIAGYYSYGVVLLGLSIGILGIFVLIRPRIDFMLSNLTVAATALLEMPHTFFYTLLVLLLQVAFVVVWALAVVGVATNGANVSVFDSSGHEYPLSDCWSYQYHNTLEIGDEILNCQGSSACNACICDADKIIHSSHACYTPRTYTWPFTLLLLSLFWTCAVLSNIVHCTTAASLSSWWILPNPSDFIVHEAFMRSITTSLGSICLGSLLVAVVRMMRSVVHFFCKRTERLSSLTGVLRTLQSFALYLLQYMMRMLDWLVSYFNRYALCFVAIYRFDFFKASVAATSLFAKRGWTAFLNDDMLDLLLIAGHLIIGTICMAVGGIYGRLLHVGHACVVLLSVAGFIGGYLISMVTLSTTSSAFSAVFVCFAENPESLEFSHPEAYHTLRSAWDRMLDPGAAADKPLQQKGGASAGGSAGKGGASEGRWKNSRPYGQGPIRPQYLELQQHDDDCVGDDGNSALPTMLDSVWNNAQSMFFGYRSVSTNPHAPTVLSNDFGRMAQSGGEDDEEDGAFSRPPSTHGTYPMASWPKSVWGVSLPQFENAKEDVQPVERSIDHAAYRTPNVTAAMDAISGFTSQLSSSVFGQRQQTDRQPSHPVRAGAKSSLRQFDTRGAAGYGRSDIDQITSSSLHSVDLEESTL